MTLRENILIWKRTIYFFTPCLHPSDMYAGVCKLFRNIGISSKTGSLGNYGVLQLGAILFLVAVSDLSSCILVQR